MKRILSIIPAVTLYFLVTSAASAKVYNLTSPDSSISVEVNVAQDITYSVSRNGHIALENCAIAMETSNGTLGVAPVVKSAKKGQHVGTYHPFNHYKSKEVEDNYNTLTLNFKGNWALEFRAYNNGAAYRFVTAAKGKQIIANETIEYRMPKEAEVCLSLKDRLRTMYEEKYTFTKVADLDQVTMMSYLPIMASTENWVMLITETDLYDYPAVFFQTEGTDVLKSIFPKVPTKTEPHNSRGDIIVETADYIAETDGARTFPWRVINLVSHEGDLLYSHLTGQMARERDMSKDWSWVKPGKVSWDWWSRFNLQGVDFEYGINTDTYKEYIDFASEFGIPYIILDEGWTKDSYTPFIFRESMDVHELIRYGKEKNVGLILWVSWLAVDKNFDTIFETYRDWGVAGMKIDFMNRSDQYMMNFYERTARKAAENKLIIDFHGSVTPKGWEIQYPNILAYEAVLGLEQKWRCQPVNTIYIPFVRNVLGGTDFTPGAMVTAHSKYLDKGSWIKEHPIGVGTRCFQLALYIVLETGTHMLADSPYRYRLEPECTKFIVETPTLWDETKVISADLGKHLLLAKRSEDVWYIGGIAYNAHQQELKLDFLGDGEYKMTAIQDGRNAHQLAMDHKFVNQTVTKDSVIDIKMVDEGGFVCRFEPLK
ncbi:MAG: glycoside hydrolase family 97 protein [Bacteroidales bacterium]|nr:glycoside hydrolase family 97 protein [Bacteroidales bacterium]